MRIAFLGCGYVANMYRVSLAAQPSLTLAAVCDRIPERAEAMARMTGARVYPDLDAILADPTVELVVNLTNPRDHYETSRAILEAGRHVYTEKPVAMTLEQAEALVALAEARGLVFVSAPCTLLNSVAQTLWKAVRDGRIGAPRLVYAEMDDGMVPREPWPRWINEMGVGWPGPDEFESGCTVEHAGYVLTWLCAMFGPVEELTAFSHVLLEDKIPGTALVAAPDFSVACLRFRSGVVARMTNGLYADRDHRLRIFGDNGVLEVDEPWSDKSSVGLRRYLSIRRKRLLTPRFPLRRVGSAEAKIKVRGGAPRDYLRAVADMADAIRLGRAPYAGARFALHVTEVTLACHYALHPSGAPHGPTAMPYRPRNDFSPVEPMAWAQ